MAEVPYLNSTHETETYPHTSVLFNKRPFMPLMKPTVFDFSSITGSSAGFRGCFTDGTYAYLAPGSTTNSKVVKFHLKSQAVSTIDLSSTDADLKGFGGAYYDGHYTKYAFFVPNIGSGSPSGKIASIYLRDSSVGYDDLTSIDSSLKGFMGGFVVGGFGTTPLERNRIGHFFVPYNNGAPFGKFIRMLDGPGIPTILDLTLIDSSLKGFWGGFSDGIYAYLVPYNNGVDFGKVVRVLLSDFSTVTVLNLETVNSSLKGFRTGFTDGRYGYFIPYSNKYLARVDLANFTTSGVSYLYHASLGSENCVSDGKYLYTVNGSGVVIRIDLDNFSSDFVQTLDLTSIDAGISGCCSGFCDGKNVYLASKPDGNCKLLRFPAYFGNLMISSV
jgi:hypothetical protein